MSSSSSSDEPTKLPLLEIPGDYGLPFFGAIKDRSDFYYNQGTDGFFKARMEKHNSTIFRCNMPPGPFMSRNPKVVVLLDAISFPILFDNSRVEKTDVLDGTFMPSTKLFGGYRTCAFLDTSEPGHGALKGFFINQLAKLHQKFVPTFRASLSGFFTKLEDNFLREGKANFNDLSDEASFEFIFRLLCGNKSPSDPDTGLGSSGVVMFDKWLFLQLSPLISLGQKLIPHFIEDLILHTFHLPSWLVKSDYRKLTGAFAKYGSAILDEAEKAGIDRDEALHNLIFLAGFNAYGGMKILFPALFKWISAAGVNLHRRLATEIRTVVQSEGGAITISALEKMSLTKSVVYEALRLDPPVPFQYGSAREDIVIRNHEASFLVKKGEMIFGYQTFATKDPKVFHDAEDFVADRFIGDDGEKLLKYLYWSNGRQTERPTAENKQCPARDLVVLLSRIMVVEFFLKYDTFEVDTSTVMLGPLVTVKSLTKAA